MFVVALLSAAAIGSELHWMPPEYAGGGLNYWQSRRIVTLARHCRPSGSVDSVTCFASYDATANIDSLLALVRDWSPNGPSREGKPFVEFAHFSSAVDTVRLSRLPLESQQRILESHRLVAWVNAMKDLETDFDLEDLWTLGTVRLYRSPDQSAGEFSPPPKNAPEGTTSGFLDRRLEHGVALISPGERFAIDSFVGMEITDAHGAAWDVDTGFATYDMRSHKQLHYWVRTTERITAADWVDSTRFVFVGTIHLDHPESRSGFRATARVPCLWLGDVAAGEMTRYLGVPIQPTEATEYRASMDALLRELYPRVRW